MRRKPIKSFVTVSLLIFLLFAPVCGVWILSKYKARLSNLHFSDMTKSYFLNPIVPLVALPMKTTQGEMIDTTKLRGKWILVYFNAQECQKQNQCASYIMNMASIAHGLKNDHSRLVRMWLTTASIPKEISQHKELTLSQLDKSSDLAPNQFYLVDPFGNMIMSYKNTTPPDQISSDIQKLMRISQIG